MSDDGTTKDDVKVPDGEVGDKIEKLFRTDEKDTSESPNIQEIALPPFTKFYRRHCSHLYG